MTVLFKRELVAGIYKKAETASVCVSSLAGEGVVPLFTQLIVVIPEKAVSIAVKS